MHCSLLSCFHILTSMCSPCALLSHFPSFILYPFTLSHFHSFTISLQGFLHVHFTIYPFMLSYLHMIKLSLFHTFILKCYPCTLLSHVHSFSLLLFHSFTFSHFHSKVFSMCTANCFDSPFFLTCAKALLMEIDTVVKDTMTVG